MPFAPTRSAALTIAVIALASTAMAQNCDGGAYLNPQLFKGEAAHQSAVAEQELVSFIGRTGLKPTPLYSIKRVDDITSSGRTPYCWAYVNALFGILSGYKPVVVNNEPIQPAVLAITKPVPGQPPDPMAVALKSLSPAEQKAVLDQLSRSKCFGTTSGIEAAIVKAEGLCGQVEDVAPQSALGQQGLIAKAAFAWEETTWAGVSTRESAAMAVSLKGLAGRVEKIHSARLVVVPTKGTSAGFGLYVHPSVPEATIKKVVAAFQGLSAPSKSLAIALDLGPQFSFISPSTQDVEKMRSALGLGK